MVLIFKEIVNSPLCSANIKECIELSSTGFKVYNSGCGVGSDPYELLNPSDVFVFSSISNNHSIAFDLRKKYYAKIKSFYIKSRINVGTCYWSFPIKFSLYGSNTFYLWNKIYSYEGSILQTRGQNIRFNLKKASEAYSMFKIDFEKFDKDYSPYWNGIQSFDLEGDFATNQEFKSCVKKSNRNIILISFLIMIS